MHPIRTILVAVKDPTASALPAVMKAVQIARACGARLELFHAIQASVYADTPAAYEEALTDLYRNEHRQLLQRLGRIAARIKLHRVEVSCAVALDHPIYDAIIRRARLIGADLIVAQRHGGGRGLLRLTDWELLRHSPLPLLLVAGSRAYHRPTVLAAVDPTHAHAKPAQLDAEILAAGGALCEALRGRLHAVHAFAPVVMGSSAKSLAASVAARLDRIAAAEAAGQVEALLQKSEIPAARRHLVGAPPAKAIAAVARKTHAAIVVMGALSRSGLKRLFIGNTAERAFDELASDLLIVKPPQFQCRVPRESTGPRLRGRPHPHTSWEAH